MSVAAAMTSLSNRMTASTCSRTRRASAVTGTAAATAYPTAGRRRRQRPGAERDRAVVLGDADNQGLRQDARGQAVLLALGIAVDLRLDGVGAGGHADRRGREPNDLPVPTSVPAGEVRGDGTPPEGPLGR